jgi:hypothetical protein
MNTTTTVLFVVVIVILNFIQVTDGDRCSCACCKPFPCTTSVSDFVFPSCTNETCAAECEVKLPENCPAADESGVFNAYCIPGGMTSQHKSNAIVVTMLMSIIGVLK